MPRKASKSSNVAELANKALAKRLRELVTDTSALAKYLDCSIQAVNQYKQGTSQPKIENIIKIADFYNVSVDYLFGITETKNRDTTTQAICQATGLSEKALAHICGERLLPKSVEFSSEEKTAMFERLREGLVKSSQKTTDTQNKMFESSGYREFIQALSEYLKLKKQCQRAIKALDGHTLSSMSPDEIMELCKTTDGMKKFQEALQAADDEAKAQEAVGYKMYKLDELFKKMVREIEAAELSKEG